MMVDDDDERFSLWKIWNTRDPLWAIASAFGTVFGVGIVRFLFTKAIQRAFAKCYSLQVNSVSHSKPDLVIGIFSFPSP